MTGAAFSYRRFLPHVLVAGAAALSIAAPGVAARTVRGFADFFLLHFDWLTLGVASGSVVFCLAAALGPWGKLRLGGADARPEFSTLSWLAMLFAAGMGAGLVFWGAAEPLIFTVSPPPGGAPPETIKAAREAYALVMFHWSVHAWSIYAASALAVAYAAHSGGRAPLPSAPFASAPVFVRRAIDWFALFAVIFGVVASLGQGAMQMAAGAERITQGGLHDGEALQIVLLCVLTAAFLASAWGGLKKGIEPLSNVNVVLCGLLIVFIFIAGPTGEIVKAGWRMGVSYLHDLPGLSVELRPEGAARGWTRDWTLTYFLWWIAWTPFVGVFTARISRGRTIREFIAGVVLIPCLVTWVWFATLGGAAVEEQLREGVDLGVSSFKTAPAATYALLEQFPFTTFTQTMALFLIFIFLVTSADSGAYVMAMFSSRQTRNPPRWERMFWGLALAALTIAALASRKGQDATRAFAVAGAAPLAFLLAAQAWVTARRVYADWRALSHSEQTSASSSPAPKRS